MLAASEKDRAENTMIVDLLRNDLSRVCTADSVDVPAFCSLETYASVHHLVSVITGELAEDKDAVALLQACFPGGSITGAPKVRSMEIIAEIERVARQVYAGRSVSSASTDTWTRTLRSAQWRSTRASPCFMPAAV
ncbi:chorismate-binding protein [Bradyrhizobium sp. LMG 9283]|uniref:chorismate-binding protein n=1 Tax=Bradyrhizobium sp. LMG 9283 TaxID=592064 RepID=UPI00388F526A